MLIGSLVVAANRIEPAGQPVLRDIVCYLAACAFRTSDIDGLAADHVAEHRCYRSRTGFGGFAGTLQRLDRGSPGMTAVGQCSQQARLADGTDENPRCPQCISLGDG